MTQISAGNADAPHSSMRMPSNTLFSSSGFGDASRWRHHINITSLRNDSTPPRSNTLHYQTNGAGHGGDDEDSSLRKPNGASQLYNHPPCNHMGNALMIGLRRQRRRFATRVLQHHFDLSRLTN